MDFLAIGPDDLRHQMCKEMIEEVEACYAKYAPNRTFTITSDPDALDGVDVIVTEEWRYINPECGEEVLDPDDYNSWLGDAESLYPYRVTSELCKRTNNPDIFCMHELPSVHNADHRVGKMLLDQCKNDLHREIITEGFEIADECFEANASVIFREAENRQHTIKAVMCALLGL